MLLSYSLLPFLLSLIIVQLRQCSGQVCICEDDYKTESPTPDHTHAPNFRGATVPPAPAPPPAPVVSTGTACHHFEDRAGGPIGPAKDRYKPNVALCTALKEQALKCAKTCDICCERPEFNCQDDAPSGFDCAARQAAGDCSTQYSVMTSYCPHTCGRCNSPGAGAGAAGGAIPTFQCRDANPEFCKTADRNDCFNRQKPFLMVQLRRKCKMTCGTC